MYIVSTGGDMMLSCIRYDKLHSEISLLERAVGIAVSPDMPSGAYTIITIIIRNYEQVAMLLNENELEEFVHTISAEIVRILHSYDSKIRLFGAGWQYYCIVPSNLDLSHILHDIHYDLLMKHYNTYFADARFVIMQLSEGMSTYSIMQTLAEHAFKHSDHQIVTYVRDKTQIISNTNADYRDLHRFRVEIQDKTAIFAFQPIVSADKHKIHHYECLLRIHDDNGGIVSAGRYIMLAEIYGFISVVDEFVFEMAIQELVNSSDDIKLSVNISSLGVQNAVLLEKIMLLLSKHDVGSRLIIEITETAVNYNFEQTRAFIDVVKEFGCKIAIDDFGAGNTSFNQLRILQVDIIKIDGAFVRDIVHNKSNKFLVETLIKMAKELDTKTVAEFVENAEIAKLLAEMGVDSLQGHFFSPAMIEKPWKNK